MEGKVGRHLGMCQEVFKLLILELIDRTDASGRDRNYCNK